MTKSLKIRSYLTKLTHTLDDLCCAREWNKAGQYNTKTGTKQKYKCKECGKHISKKIERKIDILEIEIEQLRLSLKEIE